MQGYRQVCAAQTRREKTHKMYDFPHQTKETGNHLYSLKGWVAQGNGLHNTHFTTQKTKIRAKENTSSKTEENNSTHSNYHYSDTT